jgi:hypothetical protein
MTNETKTLERQAIDDINALSLEVAIPSAVGAGVITAGKSWLDGDDARDAIKEGAAVGVATGLCAFLFMKVIGELTHPLVPAWRKTLWVLGITALVIWTIVLNIQTAIDHAKPHIAVYKEDDGTFLMQEVGEYGDRIPGKPYIKITKEKAAALGFYTN